MSETLVHFTRAPWEGGTQELQVAVGILGLVFTLSLPLAGMWARERYWLTLPERMGDWWWPLRTSGWAGLVLAMVVFHRETSRDFIYFQF